MLQLKIKWVRFVLLGLLLMAALFVSDPAVYAQTAGSNTGDSRRAGVTYILPSPNRLAFWSVRPGVNIVTVMADEIYMRQREPRNTTEFALATQRLTVPAKGAWNVSFEIRFGELGSCPTAVGLFKGDTLIGWVGADAYYKVLGTFFGEDFFTNVDLSLFPLADANWHRFEFRSNGKTLSVRRDGQEIAHESSRIRPDAIKIGEIHLLFGGHPSSLQQTETWLRAIRTE